MIDVFYEDINPERGKEKAAVEEQHQPFRK
jgi:hypothetical protein